MEKEIGEIDFAKSGGIVPVIVQDADTLKVLTLAYANKEALDLAKKTGNSWFWSRSRNKLWMKGEESGNTQKIKEILVDCDSDALVYLVTVWSVWSCLSYRRRHVLSQHTPLKNNTRPPTDFIPPISGDFTQSNRIFSSNHIVQKARYRSYAFSISAYLLRRKNKNWIWRRC